MQSLLRWSIENSGNDGEEGASGPHPPREPQKFDPGIIDAILGKSDAEQMKEALAIAVDDAREEDERVEALDKLEMLVEQIDNANNLEKLQMWIPLQNLISSRTVSDEIKTQALWVVGTAVQNNPAAQNSYMVLSPLPNILSLLSPSGGASAGTRAKAVYTLSSVLKHNALAVKQMAECGGWESLRGALQDSSIAVRRKVAFLLSTLLIPSEPSPQASPLPSSTDSSGGGATSVTARDPVWSNSHASVVSDPSSTTTAPQTVKGLSDYGVLHALVSALTHPLPHGPNGDQGEDGDTDFDEKILRSLHMYVVANTNSPPLPDEDKKALRLYLTAHEPSSEDLSGFTRSELKELKDALQ